MLVYTYPMDPSWATGPKVEIVCLVQPQNAHQLPDGPAKMIRQSIDVGIDLFTHERFQIRDIGRGGIIVFVIYILYIENYLI